MGSELTPLLAAIAAKIRTIPIFAGVEVIAYDAGNLSQKIEQSIQSGLGVVAVVMFGKIGRPGRHTLRPTYDPLRFIVRVVENAELNTDLPHAMELAERVDAELAVDTSGGTLKPWRPDLPGAQDIYRDGDMEQLAIMPRPGDEDEPGNQALDGWDVPFSTKFSTQPAQPA